MWFLVGLVVLQALLRPKSGDIHVHLYLDPGDDGDEEGDEDETPDLHERRPELAPSRN